jgi:glucose/arabinose dehydrogenase
MMRMKTPFSCVLFPFLMNEMKQNDWRRQMWLVFWLVGWWSSNALSGHAATLPPGFVETPLADGLLSRATAMEIAPDGRIFVCLQDGQLRVIKNGVLLSTPFVSLSVNANGERGLLGVAFDPNFATNHFVYVYYTATTPAIHNRVSRFTANGDVAVIGSERVLLNLENLSATNHNGGAIHFGSDGKLYIAVGENGNSTNAQLLTNRLGKILRINPDGSIPLDNPSTFTTTNGVGTTSGVNRAIWAIGLRNPFTFAVQPGTGDIFINDVGQVSWEEINEGIRGANYGWPATEGETTDPRFTTPLYAYNHTSACAIAGGAFYNPRTMQFPLNFVGKYFFADLCGGWIRRYDPVSGAVNDFATEISGPVDLKVGPDGSLYYLARGTGSVFRVRYQRLVLTSQPAKRVVPVGGTARFSVTAVGVAPLRYQWQSDGVDIPGATAASYTTLPLALANSGAMFRCVVSNGFGVVMSASAVLTVTPTVKGDFNNDGKVDLLFRDSSGALTAWYMNGTGTPQVVSFGSLSPVWTIVGTSDFNGDGRSDLLLRNAAGMLAVRLTNGAATAPQVTFGVLDPAWAAVGTGDFNSDGKSDILFQHTSGQVAVFLMNGLKLLQYGFLGLAPPPWQVVGTDDVDGDGQSDVLLRNSSTGVVGVWLINGRVRTQAATLGVVSLASQAVGMGRFNIDGRSDLVFHTPSSGALATWLLNGVAAPQNVALQSVLATWSVAGVGDFNGDKRADLVFRQPNQQITVRLMNGTISGSPINIGAVNPTWSIVKVR